MISSHRVVFGLALWFGGMLFSIRLFAAETPQRAGSPAPASGDPVLVMPNLTSPVTWFRELLALTPAARKLALTNRPPEVQKRILAKVREYESLKEEERELRLRATELQWYLMPLMSMPRTNRAARLAVIPDEHRKLVEQRLTRWDSLSPELQEELLNNEMTARHFSRLEEEKRRILDRMSPERRAKLEAGVGHWQSLSEEERQKTLQRFNAFFELTSEEMEKAVNTLSETEQRQMEKTLQSYAKLPPDQRIQCIRSFEKFTSMTLEERQLFLKNAERWKLMSHSERAAWRKLVSLAPLQPPVVPKLTLPQNSGQRRSKESLATNGH